MSTTTGALVGAIVGAALGIGGMMLWHHGSLGMDMDHGAMAGMDHGGMAGMEMEPTGDPDRDFMTMMIPHHQSAIDMAEEVLQDGTDPQVRALAEAVIATQADEIDEMNAWLAANPAN